MIRIIGNYKAALNRGDGYGTMCLEYVRALISIGFGEFTLTQAFQGNWNETPPLIKRFENKQINYDVNLIMLTADNIRVFREEGKKNIVFTMWETDCLPAHWSELCNQCDAVVVPSTFCKEVFKNSGVKVPIYILPIPTDVNKFNEVKVSKELDDIVSDKLIFYSIFQWGERKNPKALLNTYYSSFSAKDDVLLILKSQINGNDGFEIEKRVKEIRNNIKRNSLDYPKVLVVSGNLTENHINQIHKAGNVCLSSTRGEGWNLPLMDAAIAGNHIISTNFSSHTDFTDTYNYFKFQLYDNVSYQLEHCHNAGQLYTSNQKWASVNVYEFSKMMRKYYDIWKSKDDLTLQNHRDDYSKYLKTLYSYYNIGKKLLAIIEEIA